MLLQPLWPHLCTNILSVSKFSVLYLVPSSPPSARCTLISGLCIPLPPPAPSSYVLWTRDWYSNIGTPISVTSTMSLLGRHFSLAEEAWLRCMTRRAILLSSVYLVSLGWAHPPFCNANLFPSASSKFSSARGQTWITSTLPGSSLDALGQQQLQHQAMNPWGGFLAMALLGNVK